jgi:hypothetical protein
MTMSKVREGKNHPPLHISFLSGRKYIFPEAAVVISSSSPGQDRIVCSATAYKGSQDGPGSAVGSWICRKKNGRTTKTGCQPSFLLSYFYMFLYHLELKY